MLLISLERRQEFFPHWTKGYRTLRYIAACRLVKHRGILHTKASKLESVLNQSEHRYIYLRLVRLKSSPTEIARGFAAGTFTGMMPLFGIQTIFAIALATLLKGNPFAAALTTWVSNPLTFVPLYMLNFRVGQLLLGTHDSRLSLNLDMSIAELSQRGFDCLITLTVGSIATGLPLAIASYFIGLQLARKWQRDRQRQRQSARLQY